MFSNHHHDAVRRGSRGAASPAVLAVIAVGGAIGACGRHAIELAWPPASGAFPWATFAANVGGCLLIGVLMVHVLESGRPHPLARPFLGVGVLGGFTTFSTFAAQADQLAGPATGIALLYLVGSVAAGLAAVVAGTAAGRAARRIRRRSAHHQKGPAT